MRLGTLTTAKIEEGHWQIDGVFCQCGGRIRAQHMSFRRGYEWEMYCERCGVCDTGGYATLRDCMKSAREFAGMEKR